MNNFGTALIRFGIALFVVLGGGLAHAQQVQDCTVPAQLPRGPVSKSLSDCAIQHAQYLYAHRCAPGQACENEPDSVIAAYRTAARLFDLYLTGLDNGTTAHPQAVDTFWRAFLQERSHDFGNALRNYRDCQKQAAGPSAKYLKMCSAGLNRLNCVQHPELASCKGEQPGAVETVTITTTRGGGGKTASVGDGSDDARSEAPKAPLERDSVTIDVELPTASQISVIKESMTDKEKSALKQAIDEQKLTVDPK